MDQIFFYAAGVVIPLLATLLTLYMKQDFAPVFAIIGAVIGMLTVTAANSDGSITVSYPQFSGDIAHTIPLWPPLYLPILFTIVAFFAALYKVVR